MRQTINTFTFTFTLLLILSLACLARSQVSFVLGTPGFTVIGKGEVSVEADQIIITAAIERRGNASFVADLIDDATTTVIGFLGSQKISDKYIQTSLVNILPYYSYPANSPQVADPDFFIAQQFITFTIKKLDSYESVLIGLFKSGITQVTSVTYDLSNIDYYKEKARKQAISDAKQTAYNLACDLGVTLAGIFNVVEVTPTPVIDPRIVAAASYDEYKLCPFTSGQEVTITSTVSLTYYITNPPVVVQTVVSSGSK